VGTLCLEGEAELLEYRLLEGTSCRSGEAASYVDLLAKKASSEGKPVVVVLDNAPFHTAGAVREKQAEWEQKGLRLYYLPAYCPHLNPIEGVWRRLKGFSMPRRFYDSVAELKRAVLGASSLLGAAEVQSQVGGT
jgi:putative transposase